MRFLVLTAAALTLAACSQGEDAPAPAEPEASATPADVAVSDDTMTDPAILKGEIPARYLGTWDYVGGTCSADSDMLMEIAPRRITFYESLGMVTGMGQDGDDAIADLTMEGEGETWVNSLRLSLVEVDGTVQLHTSDATETKVADEFPRKKCS